MEDIKATLFLERFAWRYMKADMPPICDVFRMCVGEIIGTGILMLFGCMAGLHYSLIREFVGNISYGMTVMLIITAFGHISQSHLNPAVTICAIVLGGLPVLLAPFYFVSQVAGAILGCFLLRKLVPEKFHDGMCVTKVAEELNLWQAFMMEFMCTSLLIFLCCGVWDRRCATRMDSLPLKFGFGITILGLIAGPYTGCSMNPARTLGPAFFSSRWDHHWIYWVAPCSAGFFITILYMIFFGKRNFSKSTGCRQLKSQLPTCREIIGMCIAEFIGSILLIFFGCLSFLRRPDDENATINWFYIAIGYGSAIIMIIGSFGHISGALINPVVTIWAVIYGTLPILLGPLYLLAQFVGSIVGYGILQGLIPAPMFFEGVCVNYLDNRLSPAKGFLIELLATSLLIFVYCGVWDYRSEPFLDSSPIRIGLTYMLLTMLTGITTQAGMNPARSLAAAIYNNTWDAHWVYWVGPIIGAISSTLIYLLILSEPIPEHLKPKKPDTVETTVKPVGKNLNKPQMIEAADKPEATTKISGTMQQSQRIDKSDDNKIKQQLIEEVATKSETITAKPELLVTPETVGKSVNKDTNKQQIDEISGKPNKQQMPETSNAKPKTTAETRTDNKLPYKEKIKREMFDKK